jgi:hypothetical protein
MPVAKLGALLCAPLFSPSCGTLVVVVVLTFLVVLTSFQPSARQMHGVECLFDAVQQHFNRDCHQQTFVMESW